MQICNFGTLMGKVAGCFVLVAMTWISTPAAAQDNTLSGTYTFLFGAGGDYSVQVNMFGQQVGFCNGHTAQLPFGYSCFGAPGQDVFTGTFIADGAGNIVAGSTFIATRDPNYFQCSSSYNAAPDCPYKVPSGVAWDATASYVVGDEVDLTVGGKLLTFQAVKNNTNVAPNSSACTATVRPPNCTWDQLYTSATNKGSFKGTVSGTYTVQANGSGALKLTLTAPSGTMKAALAIVVPLTPLAVGQQVQLVGQPTLGNETLGSGVAVRVK